MSSDSRVIIELDWKDSMLNPDERYVATLKKGSKKVG